MDRTAGLGLVAYAVLVASLATGLYDPLFAGDDEWWSLLALLVFAHLALGAAVGRWWAMWFPLALSVTFFLLGGAEELAWLWLMLGAPLLVGLTAIGLALRRVRWVAAPLFAVAALPALLAEEQLADIESGGPNCVPELERRIRAAL